MIHVVNGGLCLCLLVPYCDTILRYNITKRANLHAGESGHKICADLDRSVVDATGQVSTHMSILSKLWLVWPFFCNLLKEMEVRHRQVRLLAIVRVVIDRAEVGPIQGEPWRSDE